MRMILKEVDGRELERPMQHTFTHEMVRFQASHVEINTGKRKLK